MKKTSLTKTKKLYFTLVFSLCVLFAANSFGQIHKIADMTNSKFALQNLEMGIQSLNKGVRESAIYFAGKYRFIETETALINQLNVETECDIKLLIGLALFRMKSKNGMNELHELALIENNPRVRRLTAAIYKAYLENNQDKTLQ